MDHRLERLLPICDTLTTLSPQFRFTQLRLLLMVSKHQPINQTQLADHTGLSVAAVSRAIDVLGTSGRRDTIGPALGLVQVLLDPSDDRLKLVSLTTKGKSLLGLLAVELGG